VKIVVNVRRKTDDRILQYVKPGLDEAEAAEYQRVLDVAVGAQERGELVMRRVHVNGEPFTRDVLIQCADIRLVAALADDEPLPDPR
jgi:hypothetical protein